MTMEPIYTYDKDVDILYISFASGEKATTAVELNENMVLRVNLDEKRAIGITLLDFSVLIQKTQVGPRQFPLSGLQELEPEWQEIVIAILMSPPVNQILQVSMYTAPLMEPVPIALVQPLPRLLAA
jgi:uncharacterized protein YuzE